MSRSAPFRKQKLVVRPPISRQALDRFRASWGRKNYLQHLPNPDGSKSYCFAGLEDFKDHLKCDRPHSVCPSCFQADPASCNDCRGKGWVHINDWKQMDQAKKEKLSQASSRAATALHQACAPAA